MEKIEEKMKLIKKKATIYELFNEILDQKIYEERVQEWERPEVGSYLYKQKEIVENIESRFLMLCSLLFIGGHISTIASSILSCFSIASLTVIFLGTALTFIPLGFLSILLKWLLKFSFYHTIFCY